MPKSETPDSLRKLVDQALSLIVPRVANAWSHTHIGNRVKFEGHGLKFSVKDKNGFFVISYEHLPGKIATKRYRYDLALRLMLQLFHRPPGACD